MTTGGGDSRTTASRIANEARPPRTRIDRRSALKKAAAAATVAWTAPLVLSKTAYAVEYVPGTGCTLKCAPPRVVTVTGTLRVRECLDGVPPGQQGVLADILTIEANNPCPCGGEDALTIVGGTTITVRSQPGNENNVVFELQVTSVCTDRDGDTIQRTCPLEVFDVTVQNGSCQAAGGELGTFSGTVECLADLTCNP